MGCQGWGHPRVELLQWLGCPGQRLPWGMAPELLTSVPSLRGLQGFPGHNSPGPVPRHKPRSRGQKLRAPASEPLTSTLGLPGSCPALESHLGPPLAEYTAGLGESNSVHAQRHWPWAGFSQEGESQVRSAKPEGPVGIAPSMFRDHPG